MHKAIEEDYSSLLTDLLEMHTHPTASADHKADYWLFMPRQPVQGGCGNPMETEAPKLESRFKRALLFRKFVYGRCCLRSDPMSSDRFMEPLGQYHLVFHPKIWRCTGQNISILGRELIGV